MAGHYAHYSLQGSIIAQYTQTLTHFHTQRNTRDNKTLFQTWRISQSGSDKLSTAILGTLSRYRLYLCRGYRWAYCCANGSQHFLQELVVSVQDRQLRATRNFFAVQSQEKKLTCVFMRRTYCPWISFATSDIVHCGENKSATLNSLVSLTITRIVRLRTLFTINVFTHEETRTNCYYYRLLHPPEKKSKAGVKFKM